MAKTNKPNPLKHFNDERAKRVAKLTKAQEGVQSSAAQNAKDILSRYDSMNKDLSNVGSTVGSAVGIPKGSSYIGRPVGPGPSYNYNQMIKTIGKTSKEAPMDSAGQAQARKIVEELTNKKYTPPKSSPFFIDPSKGGMNKQKKGGSTKSKKK